MTVSKVETYLSLNPNLQWPTFDRRHPYGTDGSFYQAIRRIVGIKVFNPNHEPPYPVWGKYKPNYLDLLA